MVSSMTACDSEAQAGDSAVQPATFSPAREEFRSGRQSPRDYLEERIARIEAHELNIRAFVHLDIEAARRSADEAGERYRQGKPKSAVDGMPIALKDVLETENMPTEFGSPIFKGWRGGRDSAVAYALREAGAIILGKTVTTEFADMHPGPTRNPHDLKRTPGGSSSGSAAAVAAGMVPVAIGTQVGGSILRPASFCGVIGFKPTFGAINRGGSFDNYSQNCVGTLSASLDDAWAVCHEIAVRVGGDPGFPAFAGGLEPAPPRRPSRLAVLETAGWSNADNGAKAALKTLLNRLAHAGVALIDRSSSQQVDLFERAIADFHEVSGGITRWEMLWPFAELERRKGTELTEGVRKQIRQGLEMTQDGYAALLSRRDYIRTLLMTLAPDIDACITLASPGPAPLGIASTGDYIFNSSASALRTPALSLPLLGVDGLPQGVQIIGYPNRERDLSALAGFVMALATTKA